jgi:hypothetical protein
MPSLLRDMRVPLLLKSLDELSASAKRRIQPATRSLATKSTKNLYFRQLIQRNTACAA